jgi:hypothetical protein
LRGRGAQLAAASAAHHFRGAVTTVGDAELQHLGARQSALRPQRDRAGSLER